jgi:hypothetical protein
VREISHRVETLEKWISRIRSGDTPAHLIWPAFVVDEEGDPVCFEDRVLLLESLGIDADVSREPDVWDFAEDF